MASDTRVFGSNRSLLTADDVSPVQVINPGGGSSFLFLGDHAGNRIPSRLGTLGLSDTDRTRHIAWDIGVDALGRALASALDAPFIRQAYSRLVVDCNRSPEAGDVIAACSDGSDIPGNADLSSDARSARFLEIHEPYHAAVATEIACRDADRRQTVLVALHSFTPTMSSDPRPWHIGILHDGGDPGFALNCLAVLKRKSDLVAGDNEPYRMDSIDYTIPRHAYPGSRPYVEIEIRQDRLASETDVRGWTDILAAVLGEALEMTTGRSGMPTRPG